MIEKRYPKNFLNEYQIIDLKFNDDASALNLELFSGGLENKPPIVLHFNNLLHISMSRDDKSNECYLILDSEFVCLTKENVLEFIASKNLNLDFDINAYHNFIYVYIEGEIVLQIFSTYCQIYYLSMEW